MIITALSHKLTDQLLTRPFFRQTLAEAPSRQEEKFFHFKWNKIGRQRKRIREEESEKKERGNKEKEKDQRGEACPSSSYFNH